MNWRPAIEIFIQVSTWIVAPIVLALVFGKMLDMRFETRPWIFLTFSGLAFLISSFGIVRAVSKYIKDIEKKNKN
ncbi:MAG: AtpZ/AtpI family protein [Candidatus Paceibacterota bacterium]